MLVEAWKALHQDLAPNELYLHHVLVVDELKNHEHLVPHLFLARKWKVCHT